MAFCPQCGTALYGDEFFCRNCGSKIAPTVSARPSRKGLGLAVVGQIMGIVSLVTSVFFFWLSVMVTVQSSYTLITLIMIFAFFAPFSLLAILFGSAARQQGFRGNMSKNSVYYGGTGAVVFAISLLIIFIKM